MTDYSARDIHQLDHAYPDTVKTIDDFTLATTHRTRLAEQGPAVFAAELTHGLATTFDNPLSLAGWAAVATVRLMEAGQAWTDDTDAAWAKVDELTAELTEECREHSESKAYAKQIHAELTKVQAERNNACREVARLTAALAEKDAQLTAANRRADGLQPAERAKPNVARTGCDRCSVEPGERHRYAGCLGNVSAHESDCVCWDVQSESCALPSAVAR